MNKKEMAKKCPMHERSKRHSRVMSKTYFYFLFFFQEILLVIVKNKLAFLQVSQIVFCQMAGSTYLEEGPLLSDFPKDPRGLQWYY